MANQFSFLGHPLAFAKYFMFSPVGFKGNLPLLDIVFRFYQGSSQPLEARPVQKRPRCDVRLRRGAPPAHGGLRRGAEEPGGGQGKRGKGCTQSAGEPRAMKARGRS